MSTHPPSLSPLSLPSLSKLSYLFFRYGVLSSSALSTTQKKFNSMVSSGLIFDRFKAETILPADELFTYLLKIGRLNLAFIFLACWQYVCLYIIVNVVLIISSNLISLSYHLSGSQRQIWPVSVPVFLPRTSPCFKCSSHFIS